MNKKSKKFENDMDNGKESDKEKEEHRKRKVSKDKILQYSFM